MKNWKLENEELKMIIEKLKKLYVCAIPDLMWVDFLIRPKGSCGGMT